MSDDKKPQRSQDEIKEWLEALFILQQNGQNPGDIAKMGFDGQVKEARKIKARDKRLN